MKTNLKDWNLKADMLSGLTKKLEGHLLVEEEVEVAVEIAEEVVEVILVAEAVVEDDQKVQAAAEEAEVLAHQDQEVLEALEAGEDKPLKLLHYSKKMRNFIKY